MTAQRPLRTGGLYGATPQRHTSSGSVDDACQRPFCSCLAHAFRTEASMCWTNMS